MARWDRRSVLNVGGITEFMKIVALAETHYVGLIPRPDGSFTNW
jgi:L-alanine-DL-glutamate epimerase-like enolase superfamily enzyme